MCLELRAIALARDALEKELDAIKKSDAGDGRLCVIHACYSVVYDLVLCYDWFLKVRTCFIFSFRKF